jgi:L-alanine-DL-glutamate epimerase-like enolase superfamily enzyme
MLARKKMGFTFFKMDVTTNWIGVKPGNLDDYGVPTDKGLAYGGELIAAVKDAIGWEAPLGVDTANLMLTKSVKDGIRTCRAWEKCQLAFVKDLIGSANWANWQGFKEIKAATTCKLLTGENALGLEDTLVHDRFLQSEIGRSALL